MCVGVDTIHSVKFGNRDLVQSFSTQTYRRRSQVSVNRPPGVSKGPDDKDPTADRREHEFDPCPPFSTPSSPSGPGGVEGRSNGRYKRCAS